MNFIHRISLGLTILVVIGTSFAQDPIVLEEIGTTSTGKTFFISSNSSEAPGSWLSAEYYLATVLSGQGYSFAAIESNEETVLLDTYFRGIHGNVSSTEAIWLGGTTIGSSRPSEISQGRWVATGTLFIDQYINFYPRFTIYPGDLMTWKVCLAGQYESFNNIPTFFWRFRQCMENKRFLFQRINTSAVA